METNNPSVLESAKASAMDHHEDVNMTQDRIANKKEGRTQPWKAHWPPKNVSTGKAPYGFKEGEKIVIYGN